MTNSTKEMLAGLVNKTVIAAVQAERAGTTETNAVEIKAASTSSMSLADMTKLCLDSITPRKDSFDLTPNS